MNSLEMALGCLLVCCLVATTVEYQRQIKGGHVDDPLQRVQQEWQPDGFGQAEFAKALEIDLVYPIALSGGLYYSRIFLESDSKIGWQEQSEPNALKSSWRNPERGLHQNCDCPDWKRENSPAASPHTELVPRNDGIGMGGASFSLAPR